MVNRIYGGGMKAVVTGANGFAGTHLVELLLSRGWVVRGVTNDLSLNPELGSRQGSFRLEEFDICERRALVALFEDFRPEFVFHLAALTSSGAARGALEELYRVNLGGTQNVLFSLVEAGLKPVTLVTGSGAVYGSSQSADAPTLSEDSQLNPETLYGASKLAQEALATSVARATNLGVIVTRAFNYTGPGESPRMACSSFAKQIVECEIKGGGILEVGNLESYRDFCDVRDVVNAYMLVATKAGSGGVFNVCSGRGVRMKDVLGELVSLSRVRVEVRVDPSRLRAADTSYQRGDNAKIRTLVGWEPSIPLTRTLSDLLDFWRVRLGAASLH